LEAHPELLDLIKDDVMRGQKSSNFGRGDMPSVGKPPTNPIFHTSIFRPILRAQKLLW
jgi:hypothetical protein